MVDVMMTVEIGVVVMFFVVVFIFVANVGLRAKFTMFGVFIVSTMLLVYGLNKLNYLEYEYWINAALIIVPPVATYTAYRILKSRVKNRLAR